VKLFENVAVDEKIAMMNELAKIVWEECGNDPERMRAVLDELSGALGRLEATVGQCCVVHQYSLAHAADCQRVKE
jgi:hypothetical protein